MCLKFTYRGEGRLQMKRTCFCKGVDMNALTGRLGGIFAILFVVLFVAGVFIGFNSPESSESDQAWIDYVNDDNKLIMGIIGAYLSVLGAIAFLGFLVAMYRRFRSAEAGDSGLPLLMLVTGIGWPIAMMVGVLLVAAIPGAIKLGDAEPPTPEVARWIDELGFGVMLVAGGLCAAAMSALTGMLILRTKALPAWLGYFAFVAAIAMCAAAIFIPMIIFALWMLAMGIVLLMSDEPVGAPATA
jgi:hypothetical protein